MSTSTIESPVSDAGPATLPIRRPRPGPGTGPTDIAVERAAEPRRSGRTLLANTRLMSLATVVVGASNYGFTIVLAHVLAPRSYAVFAAAQALLLTAGTLAAAAVPWVLAGELGARTIGLPERRKLVVFALYASGLQGLLGALIVFVVAGSFTTTRQAALVGASTFLVFLVAPAMGWLQGHGRFAAMATLRVVEAETKIAAGVTLGLLTHDAGLAVSGFGVGALLVTALGMWAMRRDLSARAGWRPQVPAAPVLRRLGGVATVQGLVAAFASIDIVLVAVLRLPGVDAASYQASSVVSRVPLFLAGAVAVVAFPLMVARGARSGVAARALRLYLSVAVPVAIAVALAPRALLVLVFPSSFSSIGSILRWTAVGGVAIGLIELLTTVHQAWQRYRACAARLLLGAALSVVAILVGNALDGIDGLAAGAAIGATATAALLLIDLRHALAPALRPTLGGVAGTLLFAAVLVATRPWPAVWLGGAAVLLGLRVKTVFFGSADRLTDDGDDDDFGADAVGGQQARMARRRPRVLHLAFEDHRRPGSGGGSERNRQLNAHLSGEFAITALVANYRGARDRVEDGVTYRHIGWPVGYFPSLLSYFAALPFAIRRYEADLVVEEFAAPFSSMLVPLWTRRPTLAVVQWLNSSAKSRQYKLPFFVFEWLGLRLHRDYVVMARDLATRVSSAHPNARVAVIPNAVDPAAFEVAVDRPVARGRDVVFLGRLEIAQKGLDLLLAAYAAAAPHIDGRLVLLGDGPDEERLRQLARQLGIADRVLFGGRVASAEKFRALGSARLVAMPSRYETFGIVALEAMACGTPVLAFDIDCLRDVVADEAGVRVEPYDVAAYARALRDLHADDLRVEALGGAGRRLARRYDWAELAAAQARTYRRVIDARARGRGRHRRDPHSTTSGRRPLPVRPSTATTTDLRH